MKVLIATAVPAERDAVLAGLARRTAQATVVTVGVGPASAAARTAWHLAAARYDLVISAGVAGGMPGRAGIGQVVLATRSVAADLGAESPEGFLPISTLGFGSEVIDTDPVLTHPDAIRGAVLSVCTVTGTANGVAELAARHPDAVAEAMEGFGVATAARLAGVRFAEVRTISNLVGPRDRSTWRLDEALDVLRDAIAIVTEDMA